jgi:tRNA (guanine10-N2)-dimethyltransferase
VYCLELGGEDDAFARREAATAAADVEALAWGLATASAIAPDRVRGLAFTKRATDLLGTTDASIASARTLLETAALDGPDASRNGGETVAVRARDVRGATGVSTGDAERALGQVLVDRGFTVDLDDPDRVLRVAFAANADAEHDDDGDAADEGELDAADGDASGTAEPDDPDADDDDVCAIGWETAASVRDFGDRRPTDRPFFQPGSMDPLLARAVANLAGARPGRTILDPMCGTGGVLVEAGLLGADVLGVDAQAKMAAGARENLTASLDDIDGSDGGDGSDDGSDGGSDSDGVDGLPEPGRWATMRGDATRLPIRDGAVDGVAFDAPYGRQSKIETHDLGDLVAGALAESRRVADRCVLVADRDWQAAARDAGWTVESAFERRVHASLDRYVLVLDT